MKKRSEALAERLEAGAAALAFFASTLTELGMADARAQRWPEDRRGGPSCGERLPD